jgi:hypothetical protein
MEIFGGRKFVEIDGNRTHELPPLLLRGTSEVRRLDRILERAEEIVDQADLIAAPAGDDLAAEMDRGQRRMDLAIQLVEQYLAMVRNWSWGDSVVEWIRQCETTFEARAELRKLLRPDLWPHAGRQSFVTLLEDKAVPPRGVALDAAVGLRLTFRQPPPISCVSDQFLLFLKSRLAETAYGAWRELTPQPVASLPPERFRFEVVNMTI